MAIFYTPPPPFTGGAQPLTGKHLSATTESVVVNNPPFTNFGRAAIIATVVALCQPPTPSPFIGGRQPLEAPQAAPQLLDVPVNNPPFTHFGRAAATAAITALCQPPAPSPFIGGRQPLEAPQAAPQLLNVPVNNPPFGLSDFGQQSAVWITWSIPPNPLPTLGLTSPPQLTAVKVDNPPAYQTQWQVTVAVSWISPNPLPTLPGKLSPAIPGQSVDVPNFVARSTQWQIPTDPLPTLPGKLAQGASSAVPFFRPWLVTVAASWIQSDPLPTLPGKLAQGAPSVVLPFSRSWLVTVAASWVPPDPLPIVARNLSPGIPGQSIDFPPFGVATPFEGAYPKSSIYYGQSYQFPLPRRSPQAPILNSQVDQPQPNARQRVVLAEISAIWSIPPDPLPTLNIKSTPPSGPIVVPPQLWQASPMATIAASWVPPPPLPTLPRNLPAVLIAVNVDNPPFGLLVTVVEPWVEDPRPFQPQPKAIQGVTVNNPPAYRANWLATVTASWIQPDPLPTLPRKLSPGIPGQSVDSPHFVPRTTPWQTPPDPIPTLTAKLVQGSVVSATQSFTRPWLTTVSSSWIFADPAPILPRNLSPQITAVRVDNPPTISSQLALIASASWQIPSNPIPTLTAKFTQGIVVSNTQAFTRPWLTTVNLSWIFADPAPILPRNLPPQIIAVRVDNPPTISSQLALIASLWKNTDPQIIFINKQTPPSVVAQSTQPSPPSWLSIVASWFTTSPAPTLPGKLSPGIPGQSVDSPHFLARANTWVSTQDPLPILPNKLLQGISGNQPNPPEWFATVAASWTPAYYSPSLPRHLAPQLLAVRVDNPPSIAISRNIISEITYTWSWQNVWTGTSYAGNKPIPVVYSVIGVGPALIYPQKLPKLTYPV